jgi:predicted amidophosphoribosyltransferase
MRVAGAAPLPAQLDVCRSLLVYEGQARAVITRLKYRNDRAVLGWLADGMAGLLAPPPGAVVTWAPTAARRRRQRGFDQAELLAVAVGRRWGTACVSLLARRGATAQTGRSRDERRANPVLAARRSAGGAPVVVIDDVVTTGATLSAAAAALRTTGVGWVGAVTAARTPEPRLSGSAIRPRSVPVEPPLVEKIAQVDPITGR